MVKAPGLLLPALVLALGLLESGCAPSGKPPATVVEDHLAEAEKLARAGRPRGAAELLEKFSSNPVAGNLGGLPAKIGGYYLASGANRRALRWSEEALARDPRDPAALYVKGEACRRLSEPGKAGEFLQEVLRISPAHPQASLSLARLKFRVSAPAEALPFFEVYFAGVGRDEPEEFQATARLEYGRALRAAGQHQA
ncbi:MAG: tetratricopeptide repeat protein, partial [Planctomycetota bacterium]